MSESWIKLYTSLLHDPKVSKLSTSQKWMWVALLLIVKMHGKMGSLERIYWDFKSLAKEFGVHKVSTVKTFFEKAQELNLIRLNQESIMIINWVKRQPEHDRSMTEVIPEHDRSGNKFRTKSNFGHTDLNSHAEKIAPDKIRIDKNRSDKIMIPPTPQGEECEKISINKTDDLTPLKQPKPKSNPDFETFWKPWPRKVNKKGQSLLQEAERAWNARIKEGVTAEQLLKAGKNYGLKCQEEGTEERFIMHPATFLGPNERWKEFLAWVSTKRQTPNNGGQVINELKARARRCASQNPECSGGGTGEACPYCWKNTKKEVA